MGRGGQEESAAGAADLAEVPRRNERRATHRTVTLGGVRYPIDLEDPGAQHNYSALVARVKLQPRRRLGFFSGKRPLWVEAAGKRIKLRIVALGTDWEELDIEVWRGSEARGYPGPRGLARLAEEDRQLARELLEKALG